MPWSGESFKKKHNKGLSSQQANRAARIANTVLKREGDEGKAVRIANGVVRKVGKAGDHKRKK